MSYFNGYIRSGLIKKLEPDSRQIEQQLARAEKDLRVIDMIVKEDPEWAATVAYQAMLRAARALLFAHGYLPADGQQHKTAVSLTAQILGATSSALTSEFERLRRKRNVFFYDSEETMSASEARRAAHAARDLLGAIRTAIRSVPRGNQ